MSLLERQTLSFLLYDVLDIESLCALDFYRDHNKESFEAAMDTAEQIAEQRFANHNEKGDQNEPVLHQGQVEVIEEVRLALDAYAEAGFLAGTQAYEQGGMQLPVSIMTACMGYFTAANPSTTAYPFLTAAAARVIENFGDKTLQETYLEGMRSGEIFGTMALTEPQAGSSLGDILTRAQPISDGRYHIKGSKIFISGGDHQLSNNIVHLVLARLPDAPQGAKGISLFAVPKYRQESNGKRVANDVSLAGLFHKLGYRGTSSAALSFGEKDDCVGYLIGDPHQGLGYMFQMMNEARLGVGFSAAIIGYRGYLHSLDYAKNRPQGRHLGQETTPLQVNIVEHADVKRMLLAQKAYSEGAMALCLLAAKQSDLASQAADKSERQQAQVLLDLLTPMVKAWSADYGTKANDLAIQVLGGAGYTREYPVEQCWRDNRLNAIHEGTNGIQALDLLGRKLWQQDGLGIKLLAGMIEKQVQVAHQLELAALAQPVVEIAGEVNRLIAELAGKMRSAPQMALSHANAFLNLLGHLVVAWLWLKQACVAQACVKERGDSAFYRGKIKTARYFIEHELPAVKRDLAVLALSANVCLEIQEDEL